MTSKTFPSQAGAGAGSGAGGALPCARVPRMDRGALPGLAGLPWERAAVLGPLILADGSAAAEQATTVRVGWDPLALYVRFECADRDAWGTWRQRNDPIYLEEAVEVFLAPVAPQAPLAPGWTGELAPRRYWEIEVSPLGVLFAARIENPNGGRAGLAADTSWECPGLEWQAGPRAATPAAPENPEPPETAETGPPQAESAARPPTVASQDWWAALAIPWQVLDVQGQASGGPPPGGPPPRRWRANFYRIERPRGGKAEFSCWSPTFTEPPDFHRPDRFGVLELA